MAIVARYIWQRKSSTGSYGWEPWTEAAHPRVEQDPASGHWGVYEADGSQLCLCVDRAGAERVAKRLRCALVGWYDYADSATLHKTNEGWVVHHYQPYEDFGETFPTREAAEAYIEAEPHPMQWPFSLDFKKPSPEPSEGHNGSHARGVFALRALFVCLTGTLGLYEFTTNASLRAYQHVKVAGSLQLPYSVGRESKENLQQVFSPVRHRT